MTLSNVEEAVARIEAGGMVIVVDDASRENEGDLIASAQKVTTEGINFMATHARGLICMPMMPEDFQRLGIEYMARENQSSYQTAFGVSIGSREGITTGISAEDRAHTIRVAADSASTAADIVKPGHVFPLCAKPGGVLQRNGHTEASIDLMRLAGLSPQAVICEVSNADGTMARMPDLELFAAQHDLPIISIEQLQQYRLTHESVLAEVACAHLPVASGATWQMTVYQSRIDGHEVTLMTSPTRSADAPLVRVHSACLTGDVFGSQRCDCGWQLRHAMALLEQEGGMIVYLPQEGRGIGLSNKIKAYALQEQGMDTVEANHALGFDADLRDYADAAQVLSLAGIEQIRLLTNNPKKVARLEYYGVNVKERVAIESPLHDHNQHYLTTKKNKLGHQLTLKEFSDVNKSSSCDRLCQIQRAGN